MTEKKILKPIHWCKTHDCEVVYLSFEDRFICPKAQSEVKEMGNMPKFCEECYILEEMK